MLTSSHRDGALVTDQFINPNYHVVLIHAPLALLIVGTLIEVFSFLWRRSGFRAAGRWMILIGALAAVPTVTSGLYAMWDVNNPDNMEGMTWHAIRADSPVKGDAWDMLQDHARL